MTDQNLRKGLIRLAHDNEHLRADFLGLLDEPKKTRTDDWEKLASHVNKFAATMSMPLDRAMVDVLRKAYLAGQDSGFQAGSTEVAEAGREMAGAWREVKKALEKAAPPNWGGSLGPPMGALKNLSAALWELAYWAGTFQGPQKRASGKTAVYDRDINLRTMKVIQRRHKLPGEIGGRGKTWSLEVKNDREMKQWEKVLGYGLGGFMTGYGSWILKPDFKSKGDWGDKASPHHYGGLTLAREARLASMFTAEMKLSYGEQLKLMQANAPKMGKGAGYWNVEVYSPVIRKYMSVAEWNDEKTAKADLAVWKKAHKETLGKLRPLAAKEGKTASEHVARGGGVPSALKNIARGDTKLVSEGKNIRVYTSERSIYFVEIPQKPLKRRKVRVMAMYETSAPHLPGWHWFLPVNLLKGPKGAKIQKNDTYDQALKKLQGALGRAEDEVRKVWEENPPTKAKNPDPWFPSIQQDEANYLLIEPSDTKPQSIKGKDFTVKSTWLNFEAYSPNSDLQQMDPHYTKYVAKSPAAARKFYKITKADPDSLKQVDWNKFDTWLTKHKIAVDIQFSNWS